MKKTLTVLLIAGLMLLTASCNDTSDEEKNTSDENTSAVITTEESTAEDSSNGVKTLTETEEIPFATESRYSSDMAEGTSKTEVAGVNGKKEVTYEVTYENGAEVSRKAVSEKIIEEAVNEVIVYGTKKAESPSSAAPVRPEVDLSAFAEGTVAFVRAVDDCDGSGHGYYEITLIDGTVHYQEY